MKRGRFASLFVVAGVVAAFAGVAVAQDTKAPAPEAAPAKKATPKKKPARTAMPRVAATMSDPAKAGYLAVEKIKALSARSKSVEVALPALEHIARRAIDPGVRRAALFALSEIHVKYGRPREAAMALAHATTVPQHPQRPSPPPHHPGACGDRDRSRPSPEEMREKFREGMERLGKHIAERMQEHRARREADQDRDRNRDGRPHPDRMRGDRDRSRLDRVRQAMQERRRDPLRHRDRHHDDEDNDKDDDHDEEDED